MTSRLKRAYSGPRALIGKYWAIYGGWVDFLVSPYLHFSCLLTAITFGTWSNSTWWDQVLGVVPNLLGFSLGALAIFLGFGNDKFREVIAGRRPEAPSKNSPYMSVTAAFTHFIIVQVISVLVAIVSASLHQLEPPVNGSLLYELNIIGRYILWGFGYWLFLYALFLAIASVFAVFRIASWFDNHQTNQQLTAPTPPETDGTAEDSRTV